MDEEAIEEKVQELRESLLKEVEKTTLADAREYISTEMLR